MCEHALKLTREVPVFLYMTREGHPTQSFGLYDRRIVSYIIRDTNDNPLVFDTFRAAIATEPEAHPLCHSDRGFQYTNRAFHHMLNNAGMTQSMSRVAKCLDNGPMEGFWEF